MLLIISTVLLLLADAGLWYRGEPTVSVWLRDHRTWYDYALATALFLNAILFIHLFKEPIFPKK
jgi:hypothetical protein